MPTADDSQAARDWLHAQVTPSTTALGNALANAQADGYSAAALGLAASGQVDKPIPVAVTGMAEDQTLEEYWDAWQPGDVAAADLLHDRGFQSLLADQDVTIKGIADTTLDRMGTLLAQGAEAGWSVDKIAGEMEGLLDDPSRAYGIADTELARAVSAASADTFKANGIGEWDWLTSDGACDECLAEEDSNPHSLEEDLQPPLHPTCRCAMSPRSGLGSSSEADDEEPGDEAPAAESVDPEEARMGTGAPVNYEGDTVVSEEVAPLLDRWVVPGATEKLDAAERAAISREVLTAGVKMPQVWRGASLDATTAKALTKVGKPLDFPPASFSTEIDAALPYAENGDQTPILFELEEGAKGLDVGERALAVAGYSEGEWITTGRYYVQSTRIEDGVRVVRVGRSIPPGANDSIKPLKLP